MQEAVRGGVGAIRGFDVQAQILIEQNLGVLDCLKTQNLLCQILGKVSQFYDTASGEAAMVLPQRE